MLKPVGVTIRSTQYDINEDLYNLFFGNDRDVDLCDEDLLATLEAPVVERMDPEWIRGEDEEDDTVEVFTRGGLHVADGIVRLSYTEYDERGENEVKTVITFSEKEPKNVVMSRTGAVNTAFIFEVGARTKSVYNLPFGALELTVFTIEADNRLVDEGTLVLDYCIEIRGSTAERRRVAITVTPQTPLSVPREQPLDGKDNL